MARSFGLGRGLDALIPRAAEQATSQIPIDRIRRNPHQPRAAFDEEGLAELATSIAEHGVIQPVVVRGSADGDYELVAGERRLRAARMAGLTEIPAVVRDTTASELLELALVENVQRADLNPIEEASAYRELIDEFGLTHEAVARRVGKSRVAISNSLRLLDLAPETLAAIVDGRISEGHGRALAALTIPELQRAVLQVVLERHLSVRQTEELVRRKRENGCHASAARPERGPGGPGGAAARRAGHQGGHRADAQGRPPGDRLLQRRGAGSHLRHHHARSRGERLRRGANPGGGAEARDHHAAEEAR